MLVDDRLQFTVDLMRCASNSSSSDCQHIAQCRLSDLRRCLEETHHIRNSSNGVHDIEVDHRGDLTVTLSALNHLFAAVTVSVTMRRSTFAIVNKRRTRNMPGPFAPINGQDKDDATLILLHDANGGEE